MLIVHCPFSSIFRQKLRNQARGGLSPPERLTRMLCKLADKDPDVFIHISTDTESQELVFLFIMTSRKKKNMTKFGKNCHVDTTYKINKNRMPVNVMMTMDGHGQGRPVSYAFVANEQLTVMREVGVVFRKAIGEENARKILSFTLDKEICEIIMLLDSFPGVHIELCDFHVSKTFNSSCHQEVPRVREILTELRYCWDEGDFNDLVAELRKVASQKFMDYFETNWLNYRIAWSCKDRKEVALMGNSTNNRLESHNQKLKLVC